MNWSSCVEILPSANWRWPSQHRAVYTQWINILFSLCSMLYTVNTSCVLRSCISYYNCLYTQWGLLIIGNSLQRTWYLIKGYDYSNISVACTKVYKLNNWIEYSQNIIFVNYFQQKKKMYIHLQNKLMNIIFYQ